MRLVLFYILFGICFSLWTKELQASEKEIRFDSQNISFSLVTNDSVLRWSDGQRIVDIPVNKCSKESISQIYRDLFAGVYPWTQFPKSGAPKSILKIYGKEHFIHADNHHLMFFYDTIEKTYEKAANLRQRCP